MNNWYKNKTLVYSVSAVALALVLFFTLSSIGEGDRERVADSIPSNLEAGPVSVEGAIECLPYRKPSDDQGCVKGLKGNDGSYYSLNTIDAKSAERMMGQGNEVLVKGIYQPANTESEESGVFVYEGVIVVSSIEETE